MDRKKVQQAPPELVAGVLSKSKFPLGEVQVSSGVLTQMNQTEEFKRFVMESLGKHAARDWGEVSQDCKEINDANVDMGIGDARSEYRGERLGSILILTAKGCTTIFFPREHDEIFHRSVVP